MADEEKTVTGQCYCGEVKFQVKSKGPAICLYCHCKDCRAAHGAPVYLVQIFKAEEFSFLAGEGLVNKLRNVKHPEREFERCFCTKCGSRVCNQMNTPEMPLPPLPDGLGAIMSPGPKVGAFPGLYDSVPRGGAWDPKVHVWTSEAVIPMDSFKDGLPKHTHFPVFVPANETY